MMSANPEENAQQTNRSEVSFSIVDIAFVFISMAIFMGDLITDTLIAAHYFSHGQMFLAVCTSLLIFIPAAVVQMFSMRWHILDETASRWHRVSHTFLLSILHRYIGVLKTGFKVRSCGDPKDFQRLYEQLSDIRLLHLFAAFMESAPQLQLQITIMAAQDSWPTLKCVSVVVSLVSVMWAVATYTKAMHQARPGKTNVSWPGLVCQAMWFGGVISSRIATFVLFGYGFHNWIFLLLGLNALFMIPFYRFSMPNTGKTSLEQRLYDWVMGCMYCYCFFNLREGQSRQRAFAYYVIYVSENLLCLVLFLSLVGISKSSFVEVTIAVIVGGQVLGLASMLLYYKFFHPAGPIMLCSRQPQHSTEFGNALYLPGLNTEQTATGRSLKNVWRTNKHCCHTRPAGTSPQEQSLRSNEACTD